MYKSLNWLRIPFLGGKKAETSERCQNNRHKYFLLWPIVVVFFVENLCKEMGISCEENFGRQFSRLTDHGIVQVIIY